MSYIPPRPSGPPSNPASGPKRSRKGLWIVLASLAGVALVGGGTLLGISISQADESAASSDRSQAKPKPKKTAAEPLGSNDASQEKRDSLRDSELSKKRTPQGTSSPTPSPTSTQRYTQTSPLCPSGMFVVGEGATASFTVAVCSSNDGKLTYNGASTTGGGDISLEAKATSAASWTAENSGTPPTVYVVTPERLFVSAGDTVYVDETMASWRSY